MINALPDNAIMIVLDVRRPVRIEDAMRLSAAIIRDLRSLPDIETSTPINLIEITSGSLRWAASIGALAAVAALVPPYVDMLKGISSSGPEIHNHFDVYGGGTVTIYAGDSEPIEVTADEISKPGKPAIGLQQNTPRSIGQTLSPGDGNDFEDVVAAPLVGRIQSSTNGKVLMAENGRTYEVLANHGASDIPTGYPIVAIAVASDQPARPPASQAIEIRKWKKLDAEPRLFRIQEDTWFAYGRITYDGESYIFTNSTGMQFRLKPSTDISDIDVDAFMHIYARQLDFKDSASRPYAEVIRVFPARI